MDNVSKSVKYAWLSELKIYDSLTRGYIPFRPRDEGRVSIYACGVTPQAPAHLGHMRGPVFFDVVRNWFTRLGYEVEMVQNFTDIDDKIIRRSQEEGISAEAVAQKYGQMYLEDLASLGVKPFKWVYVTKNMGCIIEMIQRIIENGNAYVVGGDVYFRVNSIPKYGKLSRRKLSEMQAGARIEIDERKENPMDFSLWKSAKPGEPSWDSPWGKGRPGWHIECSALSLAELGANFDIHAGGVDLVFPHHENEIAQSEAYLGHEGFARIWMHWGAVRLDEKKMSKSEGNVLGVREVLGKFSLGAVRLFLLGTSYRSPIEYSDARMQEAENAYQRIRTALQRGEALFGKSESGTAEDKMERFSEAMNNDFNTAGGIAVIFEAVGELNEMVAGSVEQNEVRAKELMSSIRELSKILGIPLDEDKASTEDLEQVMGLIVEWRKELRKIKQFEMADRIREDLKSVGILLEDSTEGTTWRRA